MQVYALFCDTDRYRQVMPADRSGWLEDLSFEFREAADDWNPPEMAFYPVRGRAANIMRAGCAGLALDPTAYTALAPVLRESCELLPVRIGQRVYHVVHVPRATLALDRERSTWLGSTTGTRGSLDRPALRRECVPVGGLFRTPETFTDLMTATDGPGAGPGFKAAVERLGLTGVELLPIWSDE